MSSSHHDPLFAAVDAAHRGDFAPWTAAVRSLTEPEDRDLWACALEARRWLADPGAARLPDASELGSARSARARWAASLGIHALEWAAILGGDTEGLARALGWHRSIVRDEDPPSWRAQYELAAAWWVVLTEPSLDAVRADLERLASVVADLGDAALVVEVASLRALAALGADDLDAGRVLARRASRMARTEAMPQQEYLAHVVLARLRRATGRFHLAGRILEALHRVTPAPWHPWLDWESAMVGLPGSRATAVEPAFETREAARRLRRWLAAPERDEAERPRVGAAPWSHLKSDLRRVLAAVDPSVEPPAEDDALARWMRGDGERAPAGIDGVCDPQRTDFARAHAVVLPGRAGRRVLEPGLRLVLPDEALARALEHPPQERIDTAAAILVLSSPEGLAIEPFFASVYGFAYVRARHQGVLDSLLHRVRRRIGEAGAIERSANLVRLVPSDVVVVPDPRTGSTVTERLLRLLGSGARSAKEAAAELGVPLRTLQGELQGLVTDGACLSERSGRQVVYRVEDTTFSEPTVS